MNVLKPHHKSTVVTLLHNGISQREIWRKTGIDRKTIRKLAQETEAEANSPMATGSPVSAPARNWSESDDLEAERKLGC